MGQSLPEEQRLLDLVDGTSRAEAPALAAKFGMFTRLTRGEGKPPAERQLRADGEWRYDASVRRRLRRCWYATGALLLVPRSSFA